MNRSKRLGILLTIYSFLFTCVMIEIVMRVTMRMSAPFGTAMFLDWAAEYWNPINSLGYRDVEPYSEDLTNVLVIGDSFMAGYGVNHIEERVSGVLQTELGSEYGVNIAADIAAETPHEFEALQNYPVQPDIVVWSHYVNDILWVLPDYPLVYPSPPNPRLVSLLDKFYLTTYLYHTRPSGGVDTIMMDAYGDEDAVARHLALLGEIIAYCEERDIQLIFLLWDIPTQNTLVPYISSFLDDEGMVYVDTTTFLMGRSLSEVSASRLDAHPNAAVHAEAARLIAAMIQEQ